MSNSDKKMAPWLFVGSFAPQKERDEAWRFLDEGLAEIEVTPYETSIVPKTNRWADVAEQVRILAHDHGIADVVVVSRKPAATDEPVVFRATVAKFGPNHAFNGEYFAEDCEFTALDPSIKVHFTGYPRLYDEKNRSEGED